jgi:hypothetical protein
MSTNCFHVLCKLSTASGEVKLVLSPLLLTFNEGPSALPDVSEVILLLVIISQTRKCTQDRLMNGTILTHHRRQLKWLPDK